MLDREGFRPNVGIILSNTKGQLFLARRLNQESWQFPQGGIRVNETPLEALYRELEEEVGLRPEHVKVLAWTDDWLRYRLPRRFMRLGGNAPVCVGQKQIWFVLLMLPGNESHVRFDQTTSPEFDSWRWVDYWEPVKEVIFFKRYVYKEALKQLAPAIFPNGAPPYPWKRKVTIKNTETQIAGKDACDV